MKCTRFMLKFKLTAINDAYQGPYKTRYRWWTGIMLLVRTLLILFFTANILGNQRLNLLFVVTVCVVILAFMWNVGTVYKDWRVNINIIESSLLLISPSSLPGVNTIISSQPAMLEISLLLHTYSLDLLFSCLLLLLSLVLF